jgi:hypothetical protein
LKLKAHFYHSKPDFDVLYKQIFALQVRIKEHQEATREVVFKTRQIVRESTSTSRLLIQLFLNSLDLYEILLTSTNDYRKLLHLQQRLWNQPPQPQPQQRPLRHRTP